MLHRIIRLAYSPPVSDLAGYKTFVDPKSEKNLRVPEKDPQTRGPQELPQSTEKERPLPLPSDHDEKRDKVIGPTHFNTPNETGGPSPRTKSVPGDQYGHPSKNDYNYPRRRQDVTGRVTFPEKHQRETKGPEEQKLKQDYQRRGPQKRLTEKLRYRQEGKRDPDRKRYNKLYNKYPARFDRRKPALHNTPAERTKAWREDQKNEADRAGRTPKEQEQERKRPKPKTAGDPTSWYTVTKETVPPGQLDQNFRETPRGAPKSDKTKQEGESLRAPNLDAKPQKGLRAPQTKPKPNSGIRLPTVQSPGDGSGKVIPNGLGYTNHSQDLGSPTRPAINTEQAKMAGRSSLRRIVLQHLDAI